MARQLPLNKGGAAKPRWICSIILHILMLCKYFAITKNFYEYFGLRGLPECFFYEEPLNIEFEQGYNILPGMCDAPDKSIK